MKRWMTFLLACFLCFSALPACAEWTDAQREEADAFFARLFAQKSSVGGAVIVNQGGERVYAYFHGRAGGRRAVTEDTVYKVASITKMITAIGVMRLVEEGKLELDAPILDSQGEALRNPRFPDQDITLRQVMSHTSSIRRSANYTGTPKWTEKYFNEYAPGAGYEYANLNGGLLGSLIERVSGQSVNAYMAEHVFGPLQINAAYAATLLPDPTQLANSFGPDGQVIQSAASYLRVDAGYDDSCDPDTHFRTTVGSLYISLKGLEALGAMLANEGMHEGVRLLRPGSVHLMQMNQAAIAGSVTAESPYGLNTYRFVLDGTVWYGHQGWWSGRLADLFYEPESRTAVVLMMSGNNRTVGTENPEVSAQMERTLRFIAPFIDPGEIDWTIIDEEGGY